MERILIFIKHNFKFLWDLIDLANSFLFSVFFSSKLEETSSVVLSQITDGIYSYRILNQQDAETLAGLIERQTPDDMIYFHPHAFDLAGIRKQFKIKSFLMMGVFDNKVLIGYFFLRFFVNKRCFVGRLIDKTYRGKGIGQIMNNIMYETAWRMHFRCLSTISRNNTSVIRAHEGNKSMVILKQLQNDYLLVEFIQTY